MKKIIILFLICNMSTSWASVVMLGTRIIIPSASLEKTVQFNNPDPQPYIVEIKLDGGDKNKQLHVPFITVPPVFRIEANQGQTVRIITSEAVKALPQDRESVFYMDFTQIPAIKSSDLDKNKFIIAVKSRIKIFFRPDTMKGLQSDAYKSLEFSLKDGKVVVVNPTGYYISIRKAKYVNRNLTLTLTENVMLAPFSTSRWSHAGKITSLHDSKILISQVNDYGAYIEEDTKL